ncbi:MAG TPA: SUMF1/EgtB/PvdO family nonheme iron enzyme [Planctomycetota bacterium]|jgi:formylglycine-generating enzyme required for sulfatase activity
MGTKTTLLPLVLLSCCILYGADADPAFYKKQATWEETVRISREALLGQVQAAEKKQVELRANDPLFKNFKTVELALKSGDAAAQLKVPCAGLKSLFVRCQTRGCDAYVANAKFIGKDGKGTNWDRVQIVNHWGEKKLEGAKNAISIQGKDTKNYRRWRSCEVEFALDGKFESFEAWILPAEGNKNGSVALTADCFSFYAPRDQHAADAQLIWNLVRRDFGEYDKTNRVAIGDPEKILESNWTPGDFKGLAGRYAGKCSGEWKTKAGALVRDMVAPASAPAGKDTTTVSAGTEAGTEAGTTLAKVREFYYRTLRARDMQRQIPTFDSAAMLRAIEDLAKTYPAKYQPEKYRACVQDFEKRKDAILEGLKDGKDEALADAEKTCATLRESMLANPLLDFDKILLVKRNFKDGSARHVMGSGCGLIGLNSHTNDDIPHSNWDNEIGVVSNLRGAVEYKRVHKPAGSPILRDLDLEFDGERVMFSSINDQDRWGLFEVKTDGSGLKQLTPKDLPDVDFFDSCYLPDGRIITASTAGYQGLPCENGGKPMVNLYQLDPGTQKIRQLTFEQDSDWHPSILNDGRVLYLRWEYTDIMHYYSRRLFSMNPDGTTQMAYYGSGSMFPPGFKFARAVPGHPSKIAGVIAGHHDFPEHGRLAIVDPDLASAYPFRFHPKTKEWGPDGSYSNVIPEILPAEKTGFVQEIPGWGKPVVGNVCDGIAQQAWKEGKPQFLNPWPLNDKYYLVTMKRNSDALWGIYLVDIFDNMTLIAENETAGYFQPIPLLKRTRPPLIQDRIDEKKNFADVMITDIYAGPGLKGIPKGKVKSIRVLAYHYAYLGRGGHEAVGFESSWDVKRILGTSPVEADGSAHFLIPANTPVFLQPLNDEGAALQLMRTWFVGMPAERISCVGCHEKRGETLPLRTSIAGKRDAKKLDPWYGESRPFAFQHEVFPVVEKYCMGCHDGSPAKKTLSMKDAQTAYNSLHPYCRRPGPESDMEMFVPMEYHGSTSPLIQLLKKGHYGVQPDKEAYERLYCWIDCNVPMKGQWTPDTFRNQPQEARRKELAAKFANVETDPEEEYRKVADAFAKRAPVAFVQPVRQAVQPADNLKADGFPMTAEAAIAMQKSQAATLKPQVSSLKPDEASSLKSQVSKTVTLSGGMKMDFVFVPAGKFVMGNQSGYADEQPRTIANIGKPFWMGATEVTNAQYEKFDPNHDTRYIDEHGKDHTVPGYIANHPDQPVARISWQEAMAFCQWMSRDAGVKANLPTEAQWEWAARAGTATQFFYGDKDTDFGKFANLADRGVRFMRTTWDGGSMIHKRREYPVAMNFPLHEERFEDKWFVVDYVGQCEPNAWSLKDMVGNVSEWTRSSYKPYPYKEDDGRNSGSPSEPKVARGGSWADRPVDAGASVRRCYEAYQKVHDVGFRVIIEE